MAAAQVTTDNVINAECMKYDRDFSTTCKYARGDMVMGWCGDSRLLTITCKQGALQWGTEKEWIRLIYTKHSSNCEIPSI